MSTKQPADSTDDAIRPSSAPIELSKNPNARPSAAQGNPSRVRDESDTHYSSGYIR